MSIEVDINYRDANRAAQELAQLTQQFSHLLSESEQAALATQRFEAALSAEASKAAAVRRQLAESAAAHRGLASASAGATAASRAQTRGMAEVVNMATEMSLGLGGLHPQLRELSIGLAMGGNNAVQMAGALGPVGIGIGLLTGVLPTLITMLVNSANATDEAGGAMRRHSQDTQQATRDLQAFIAAQRTAQRLMAGEGSFAETAPALSEAIAVRDRIQMEIDTATEELEAARRRAVNIHAQGGSLRERIEAREGVSRAERALESVRGALANAEEQVSELERRAQVVLQIEGTLQMEADDAIEAEEDEARRSRRRGRRRSDDPDEFDPRRVEAYYEAIERGHQQRREAEAALANQILAASEQEVIARRKAIDEERAAQHAADEERLTEMRKRMELAQQEHEQHMEGLERAKEKERELAEQRLQQAREITGRIGDTLQTIASAYIDAFQKAIEGQMSAEEAALQATKTVLKGLGEQMVAIGIRETLEGIANTVSAPPVAATKIPMGIALIGFGVGLGAAGAAIPSAPSVPPERPREEPTRGGEGGPQTLVLNNFAPMLSAGTHAQLARAFREQFEGREIPTRVES